MNGHEKLFKRKYTEFTLWQFAIIYKNDLPYTNYLIF